ncbi:MAG TPA: hypothetical protein VG125_29250 [Pirellulales bacterium]|jgi:hypothetical protein|nr:hypothetical protein [Pirellulales bacterium]
MVNPYEAPTGSGPPVGPQASLLRGLACSVPAAVAGGAVPLMASTTILLIRHICGDSLINVEADFHDLPKTLASPCIGCALVFGLASILNYAPPSRLGMVRAVLCVGLSVIASLIITGFLAASFGLSPRTYTSDPWAWLRVSIWGSLILAYTAVHTVSRWRSSEPHQA